MNELVYQKFEFPHFVCGLCVPVAAAQPSERSGLLKNGEIRNQKREKEAYRCCRRTQ